jgi:hypothetical protein
MRRADEQFPGYDSVAAFLALALTSAGRCQEAVARLIVLALDRIGGEDLEHYEWRSGITPRNYPADNSGRRPFPANLPLRGCGITPQGGQPGRPDERPGLKALQDQTES